MVTVGVDGDRTMVTGSVNAQFPTVQPMPGGRVLICGRRVTDGATNAWIFSPDGDAEAVGHIGDGIAHVLTTLAGSIWVGYFDEGVYSGNDTAHHGIVRFNDSLTPDWTYPFDSPHGVVDDCYTLNVIGEIAVSCFYSNFPIVRVSGGDLNGWTGVPSGSHGLLQNGDSVLLFGGYAEERERVVRLELGLDGAVYETGRGTIRGGPGKVPTTLLCRGGEAHLFAGAHWYKASM